MTITQRAIKGAAGGFLATIVLSGLRASLNRAGAVNVTAPEQVVRRMEELGLVDDWSQNARRALMVGAHFGYGTGAGTVFGALRSTNSDPQEERGGVLGDAAVGTALGVLAWGAGWGVWLPLLGVHPAPWNQDTPRALLPVLDHAAFGCAWGLAFRALGGKE